MNFVGTRPEARGQRLTRCWMPNHTQIHAPTSGQFHQGANDLEAPRQFVVHQTMPPRTPFTVRGTVEHLHVLAGQLVAVGTSRRTPDLRSAASPAQLEVDVTRLFMVSVGLCGMRCHDREDAPTRDVSILGRDRRVKITDRMVIRTAIALSGITAFDCWLGCLGYGSELYDLDHFTQAFADPILFTPVEARIAALVVNERLTEMGLPQLA